MWSCKTASHNHTFTTRLESSHGPWNAQAAERAWPHGERTMFAPFCGTKQAMLCEAREPQTKPRTHAVTWYDGPCWENSFQKRTWVSNEPKWIKIQTSVTSTSYICAQASSEHRFLNLQLSNSNLFLVSHASCVTSTASTWSEFNVVKRILGPVALMPSSGNELCWLYTCANFRCQWLW